MGSARPLSPEHQAIVDLGSRIGTALTWHEPVKLCVAHQQRHDCGSGFWYRCYECARTRVTPCRTWQALTGKEVPE